MEHEPLAARISRRAVLAGLEPQPALTGRLAAYVELLQRWNARLNLTALDDSDHGLDRLVIEPLAAARHVPRATLNVIDIGSGSGSPAIPLRIALGGTRLVLVEARQRKAAFLREAVRRLELADCTVE
ncbi:MAG: class I SAM-dependent methyltransferase, partial [Rhodospirillaceae bacterium]|nr:class I SAM-dependent methyltransferase [Rhodospirillaceae bacterium]